MSRSRASDPGLTLVELVVAVSLIALVMTALAATMTVFLRNQTNSSDRLDDSRDLQQVVNYLPGDVGSARVVDVDPPWTQPCLSTGTPILNLVSTEAFPGATAETISITYVLTSGGTELVRNHCDGGLTTVVVAREIGGADAVFTAGTVCGDPVSVDVMLQYDASTSTMSASSRNRTVEDGCP